MILKSHLNKIEFSLNIFMEKSGDFTLAIILDFIENVVQRHHNLSTLKMTIRFFSFSLKYIFFNFNKINERAMQLPM